MISFREGVTFNHGDTKGTEMGGDNEARCNRGLVTGGLSGTWWTAWTGGLVSAEH